MNDKPTLKQHKAFAALVYSSRRTWSWIEQEQVIAEILGEKVKLADITKQQMSQVIGVLMERQESWLKNEYMPIAVNYN